MYNYITTAPSSPALIRCYSLSALQLPSHLNADRGGESCHNWLTDVLDEEAEVEDAAQDLDHPRKESESDRL